MNANVQSLNSGTPAPPGSISSDHQTTSRVGRCTGCGYLIKERSNSSIKKRSDITKETGETKANIQTLNSEINFDQESAHSKKMSESSGVVGEIVSRGCKFLDVGDEACNMKVVNSCKPEDGGGSCSYLQRNSVKVDPSYKEDKKQNINDNGKNGGRAEVLTDPKDLPGQTRGILQFGMKLAESCMQSKPEPMTGDDAVMNSGERVSHDCILDVGDEACNLNVVNSCKPENAGGSCSFLQRNLVQVDPSYLRTLGQSHSSWIFGAIAEFIDNSRDAKATKWVERLFCLSCFLYLLCLSLHTIVRVVLHLFSIRFV